MLTLTLVFYLYLKTHSKELSLCIRALDPKLIERHLCLHVDNKIKEQRQGEFISFLPFHSVRIQRKWYAADGVIYTEQNYFDKYILCKKGLTFERICIWSSLSHHHTCQ